MVARWLCRFFNCANEQQSGPEATTELSRMSTNKKANISMTTEDGLITLQANKQTYFIGGRAIEPDSQDQLHITLEELLSLRNFSLPSASYKLLKERPNFFGGRLIQWATDNWAWIDGEKELRVFARTLAVIYPNLERSSYPVDEIEVPVALAKGHVELAWVVTESGYPIRAAEPTNYDYDFQPDQFSRRQLPGEPLPLVYAVPMGDWNARAQVCLGPTWKSGEQYAIYQKATALGWSEGDPI